MDLRGLPQILSVYICGLFSCYTLIKYFRLIDKKYNNKIQKDINTTIIIIGIIIFSKFVYRSQLLKEFLLFSSSYTN